MKIVLILAVLAAVAVPACRKGGSEGAVDLEALPVACPATITVEQTLPAVPTGWSISYNVVPARLESVIVSDGPPHQRPDMRPATDETVDGSRTVTWSLPERLDPRGYWLTCRYDRTTAEIARPLPRKATTCTATYTAAPGAARLTSATCQ